MTLKQRKCVAEALEKVRELEMDLRRTQRTLTSTEQARIVVEARGYLEIALGYPVTGYTPSPASER